MVPDMLNSLDDREDYGEERFVTFGLLDGRVVAVVHTETEDTIRVISIRKAKKREQISTSKASKTAWKRVDALRDEEIDLSDNPEVTPEMFAKAIVRRGLVSAPPKEQVTLRLDVDVLKWFRSQGQGYQTQINALLRAYMEARTGK